MSIKYIKWPQNIPNGCKLFEMTKTYTNIFGTMYTRQTASRQTASRRTAARRISTCQTASRSMATRLMNWVVEYGSLSNVVNNTGPDSPLLGP
jgi:hypothetical protein